MKSWSMKWHRPYKFSKKKDNEVVEKVCPIDLSHVNLKGCVSSPIEENKCFWIIYAPLQKDFLNSRCCICIVGGRKHSMAPSLPDIWFGQFIRKAALHRNSLAGCCSYITSPPLIASYLEDELAFLSFKGKKKRTRGFGEADNSTSL
jgi:hypothetical protein